MEYSQFLKHSRSFLYNNFIYKSIIPKSIVFIAGATAGIGIYSQDSKQFAFGVLLGVAATVLDYKREGFVAHLAREGKLEKILQKEDRSNRQ